MREFPPRCHSLLRSLAERRITSVFDGAAAAFPSLFSPSDENCSSLSSGPLRQEWRRTNGANATRSDRGERSPIELLWSSGGRDFRNRRKWPVFLRKAASGADAASIGWWRPKMTNNLNSSTSDSVKMCSSDTRQGFSECPYNQI